MYTEAPQPFTTADLTEAMMSVYGHRLPLDLISRTVHQILADYAHPHGVSVPPGLCDAVVNGVSALAAATDAHPRAPQQRARPGQGMSEGPNVWLSGEPLTGFAEPAQSEYRQSYR